MSSNASVDDENSDTDSTVSYASNHSMSHPLCTAILSKGKRKGQLCNRRILQENDPFCKFHLGKSTENELCTIILTKGERKNQPCNRKIIENSTMCKIHAALEEKRPYNPYIDKETDAVVKKGIVRSKFGSMDVSRLHPECIQDL